jgi:hypothetical protein
MMTFDRVGEVAHGVQAQFDDQVKQLARWMKPHRKQLGRLANDLRPFGEQALSLARKHPGKAVGGALVIGYLLARLGRR